MDWDSDVSTVCLYRQQRRNVILAWDLVYLAYVQQLREYRDFYSEVVSGSIWSIVLHNEGGSY